MSRNARGRRSMKATTAGILGVLILGGMPSSLAVAGQPTYGNLQGAFRRACDDLGMDPTRPLDEACLFVAQVLKPLAPPPIDTASEETEAAILDAFLKATPGLRRNSPCTECELAVDRLEIILGMEEVPSVIARTLGGACVRKLSDPTQSEQCRELADPVPALIEFILQEFPPAAVCIQLEICSLE